MKITMEQPIDNCFNFHCGFYFSFNATVHLLYAFPRRAGWHGRRLNVMSIKQLRALLMRDACVRYLRLKAESNHFLFSPRPILRTRATGTAGARNAERKPE